MTKQRNGWNLWYEQWDDRYGDQLDGLSYPVEFEHLSFWGEQICQMVMLNDHWVGYTHPEPMSLEDGMTIAFVLYDAHVDVDELITLLDEFEPLEGAIARVGVPLCWLTEPMDHVQDLLGMLEDTAQLDDEVMEQMRQTLQEMTGEQYTAIEEILASFHAMSLSTAQFLMEVTRLLGDEGRVALRAWWQGRLISLLRENAVSRKRKHKRSSKPRKGPDVPSAFKDLIRGLDLGDLETDEGEE